jgi:predicted RNA-binding Zn ribbon-like protein
MECPATVRPVIRDADYQGPIRDGPLPIELHNTLYAAHGQQIDGLADTAGLRAWLTALGDGLPVAADEVDGRRFEELHALRGSVREALHAAVERRAMSEPAVAHLNELSARDPRSPYMTQRGQMRATEFRHHALTPTDKLLGVIAASTIELVSGPRAADVRACGAPGCVLMFLKDHPRREWCSAACGNRARQARHYARSRRAPRRA